MKERTYYGAILDNNGHELFNENGVGALVGCFRIVGEMCDGKKVYEQVDKENNKQYLRFTKYGSQYFMPL